jgi:hypothetical protein
MVRRIWVSPSVNGDASFKADCSTPKYQNQASRVCNVGTKEGRKNDKAL